LIFISCGNKTDKKFVPKEITEKTLAFDTVFIDYSKNKRKLEILALLPDSCFGSWEWTKDDRKILLNEIKNKGFFIDKTPDHNTIKEVVDNYLSVQVVDGIWEMSIYKIKEGNYFVITNDVVGDGSTLNFYEYNNGVLVLSNALKLGLNDNLNKLFKNPESEKCKNSLNELLEINENIFFSYNFKTINKIRVSAAWEITNDEFSDCFKGNSLQYLFNSEIKKFQLIEIEWIKNE
jgi:hypothetical protein